MWKQHQVRLPCVAGAFYPGDTDELRLLVDKMLTQTREAPVFKLPCVLVVPHAGYTYCGMVAGAGYSAVTPPERVLLLGVSHREAFAGAALYDGDRWRTPLGDVSIDRDTVQALCAASEETSINNAVHTFEHGLEVQLPFLQRIAPQIQIVPVLLGQPSLATIQTLGLALAHFCDNHTLLVVSSDLSHYPTGADAERVDRETIAAILEGNPSQFQQVVGQYEDLPGVLTRACGAAAITTGMYVAQHLGLGQTNLLAYAHSGHVSHDDSRVVGYASIAFSSTT